MILYLREVQSLFEYFLFKLNNNISYKNTFKNKKETIFIFGSGPSLNKLTDLEIIGINNTGSVMGFNNVFEFNKIKFDYYLIREFFDLKYFFKNPPWKYIISSIYSKENNKRALNFINKVDSSCKLIFHIDKFSGSVILALKKLKHTFKDYIFYKNPTDRKRISPFSDKLNDISHANCSLADTIQIASILGYKKIFLVGVDLGTLGHFYGEVPLKSQHKTLPWISNALQEWTNEIKKKNIEIEIYNPKSMLNNILKTYDKKNLRYN